VSVLSERETFAERFSVSRETIDRLVSYEELITKWNPTINLTAKSTLGEIWTRHFLDSAEVFAWANPSEGRWLDLGSGGGFPGVVVAILAKELAPKLSVTCVESDIRKCEFMRTVARNTGVSVGILSRRVQDVPSHNAQIVSARALASLTDLIGMAQRHLAPQGCAIFHKGKSWQDEVDEALETWEFTLEKKDNPTHQDSVILKIGDIQRA